MATSTCTSAMVKPHSFLGVALNYHKYPILLLNEGLWVYIWHSLKFLKKMILAYRITWNFIHFLKYFGQFGHMELHRTLFFWSIWAYGIIWNLINATCAIQPFLFVKFCPKKSEKWIDFGGFQLPKVEQRTKNHWISILGF
jgi:hypothetical protein